MGYTEWWTLRPTGREGMSQATLCFVSTQMGITQEQTCTLRAIGLQSALRSRKELCHDNLFTAPIGLEMQQPLLLLWLHAIYAYITSTHFLFFYASKIISQSPFSTNS
jgi:hypothetical protein